MTDPFSRDDIARALEARSQELVRALAAFDERAFMAGSTEAWGPAQHATHLAYIHERVRGALSAPDNLPAATAPPRGYSAIRAAYRAALAETPAKLLSANSRNGAPAEGSTQAAIIARYTTASRSLREAIATWDDAALDQRAIPHPLLGPLPVRDMLLFMLYHDQHHLDGINKRK